MKPFTTSTYAGTPVAGNVDASYLQAQFSRPSHICKHGEFIFVTDRSIANSIRVLFNNHVRSLKWKNSHELLQASGMAFLGSTLFVADRGHDKLRYIALPEQLTELWFNELGQVRYELQTLQTGTKLKRPVSILTLSDQSLIVSDSGNSRVCKISVRYNQYNKNFELLQLEQLCQVQKPEGMCFYRDGILITDSLSHQIAYFNLITRQLDLFAGTEVGFQDGPLHLARFRSPCAVGSVDDEYVYVVERDNSAVREIHDSTVRTIAGGRQKGYCDGIAEINQFNEPNDMLCQKNTYFTQILICDCKNCCIRELINTQFKSDQSIIQESGIEVDISQKISTKLQERIQLQEIKEQMIDKINNIEEELQVVTRDLKGAGLIEPPEELNQEEEESPQASPQALRLQHTAPQHVQELNYKIEPYDTLNQLLQLAKVNPTQFFTYFNKQPYDPNELLQYALQFNCSVFIPVSFGYMHYFKFIGATKRNNALSEGQLRNIKALQFFKQLVTHQLLNYSPLLFKSFLQQPYMHSACLAIANYNCVKLRLGIGNQILYLNEMNQFIMNAMKLEKYVVRVWFEIQIVSLLEWFNNITCRVQFKDGLVNDSKLHYVKGEQLLFREHSLTLFYDRFEYDVDTQVVQKLVGPRTPQLVQEIGVEVWDRYKIRLGLEIGPGATKKTSTVLPRVFALEQVSVACYV